MNDLLDAARKTYREAPEVNPLVLTGMLATTMASSQTAAKRVATDQAKQESKSETIYHGDGTVTMKRVPALDTEKAVEDASNAPYERAFKALKSLGIAREEVDYGDDPTRFKVGYRASRATGGNVFQAFIDALRVASGAISPENARRQASAAVKAENSAMYQKYVKPIENEVQQDDRFRLQERRERRQTLAELARRGHLLGRGATTDDVIESVNRQMVGLGFEPLTQGDREFVVGELTYEKGATNKAVNSRINSIRDDDVRGFGGSFDQWLAAQEDEVGDFPQTLRDRAKARFAGIRKEMEDKEMKTATEAARADARDARATAASERAARTEDRTLSRADAAERRRELDAIAKQIDENNREITRTYLEYKKLDPVKNPDARAAVKLVNEQKRDENKVLRQRLDQMYATRQAAPKVGDRRDFPNGNVGEWDGRGWKLVGKRK